MLLVYENQGARKVVPITLPDGSIVEAINLTTDPAGIRLHLQNKVKELLVPRPTGTIQAMIFDEELIAEILMSQAKLTPSA